LLARKVRLKALTTPAVTLACKPNGLPIATTSWPMDPQERQIGIGIGADLFGFRSRAVGKQHFQRWRFIYDVVVRQHVAVRGDHDSRSAPLGAVKRSIASRAQTPDADKRRPHSLDDAGNDPGVGVKRCIFVRAPCIARIAVGAPRG
jgi:hypothetical protein